MYEYHRPCSFKPAGGALSAKLRTSSGRNSLDVATLERMLPVASHGKSTSRVGRKNHLRKKQNELLKRVGQNPQFRVSTCLSYFLTRKLTQLILSNQTIQTCESARRMWEALASNTHKHTTLQTFQRLTKGPISVQSCHISLTFSFSPNIGVELQPKPHMGLQTVLKYIEKYSRDFWFHTPIFARLGLFV